MSNELREAIAKSSDPAWLKRCREHNASLGRKDVVDRVEQRLRDLDLQNAIRIQPEAQTLEARVYESLRVYREILKHKHGRNQAAGYTEREIKQKKPRGALIDTIRRGKKTEGLKQLADFDRLDCSYEQIAIDFAHELPGDVVERARQVLEELKAANG
jgi:hypothetical protein